MHDTDPTEWDEYGGDGRRSAAELRHIARYQRWLIVLILAELALWVAYAAVSAQSRRADAVELLLASFTLAAAAYVFMLEATLNGVVAGLMGGLISLVPVAGVLLQVVVNRGATAELTAAGLEVGLFGASPADVTAGPRWTPYDVDPDTGW